MCLKRSVLVCLSCFLAQYAKAGDAVVIGFNGDGIWTAVTYNRSSTPKGGPHYGDKSEAIKLALRDLRFRAGIGLATTAVVGDSDKTGYVAVARGTTLSGRDITAVGHRKSQEEADERALEELNETGAKTNQTIIYRYFSYGADSGTQKKEAPVTQSARRRAPLKNSQS